MSLSRAARLVLAAVGVTAMALTACSTDTDAPRQLDGWHALALPAGMVPSTLQVGTSLTVGGYVPTGADRAPALATRPRDQTDVGFSPVPVTPATPYGKVADLVSLTGDTSSVVALGAAHGGAHANFRWTIWTGPLDRLTDRLQTFETFGGWEAGTLLGVATDTVGPLVVGTWQGEHGLDGAVWRADGERWVREPTPDALANTAQRQVAPQTVSQSDDASVVVNGSVVDLTDGVRQSAAVWRDTDGAWSLTVLPDPGARSMAWSTACASTCWTAGGRDGTVAVWSDAGRAPVPSIPVEDADSARVVVGRDRVVVVASSAGAGRMLVGAGDHWRAYTAPDGIPRAAALVGTDLYLVTGTEDRATVWVRDLRDVLSG